MEFEFDPKQLIAAVKNRPEIWNKKHPNYKMIQINKAMWTEIVQELVPKDMQLSSADTYEIEQKLRQRWKSYRDYFYKGKKTYIHYKDLCFLLENKDSEEEDEEEMEPTPKKRSVKKSKSTTKRRKQSDDSSYGPQLNFVNIDEPDEEHYEGSEEKMFLLSLLPYLMDLPKDKRLQARIEMLQLLKSYSAKSE